MEREPFLLPLAYAYTQLLQGVDQLFVFLLQAVDVVVVLCVQRLLLVLVFSIQSIFFPPGMDLAPHHPTDPGPNQQLAPTEGPEHAFQHVTLR